MNEADDHCDVLIAGGGVVGAALAAALRDAPLDVRLVSPANGEQRPDGDRAAGHLAVRRPIALARPATEALRRLGFQGLDAATAIRTIHVSQQGRFGRTILRASDHDLPALGHVFDGRDLDAAAARIDTTTRIDGAVSGWNDAPDAIRVTIVHAFGGDRQIDARLLVLAEGGALPGLDTEREYAQTAWCGTVCTTVKHDGVAWERFTPHGPLALLPFEDRYAFVWARAAGEDVLEHADDETFCAALRMTFGERLGRFTNVSARFRIPLALRRRTTAHAERIIAVGNASQTLHPVAGQGLNLGLRDALALAGHVRKHAGDDAGSRECVGAFVRARTPDRLATVSVTDGLVRLFSSDDAFLSAARGIGLAALDACPPARAFLARRMMLGARGIP